MSETATITEQSHPSVKEITDLGVIAATSMLKKHVGSEPIVNEQKAFSDEQIAALVMSLPPRTQDVLDGIAGRAESTVASPNSTKE